MKVKWYYFIRQSVAHLDLFKIEPATAVDELNELNIDM